MRSMFCVAVMVMMMAVGAGCGGGDKFVPSEPRTTEQTGGTTVPDGLVSFTAPVNGQESAAFRVMLGSKAGPASFSGGAWTALLDTDYGLWVEPVMTTRGGPASIDATFTIVNEMGTVVASGVAEVTFHAPGFYLVYGSFTQGGVQQWARTAVMVLSNEEAARLPRYVGAVRSCYRDPANDWGWVVGDLQRESVGGIDHLVAGTGQRLVSVIETRSLVVNRGGSDWVQDQPVFDSVETTVFYAPTDQNEVAVDRMKLKRAAIDRYPYDSYDSGGAWSVRSPGLYLVEIRGIRLRGEVTVNVIVPLKVLESKG